MVLGRRAVSTVTTVMSRSRSQETVVTTVTGAFTFKLHETSQRILRYGNDIQSHRERGYEQPVPVTHSAKIEYAHTHFPPIAMLVRRACS